MNKKFLIFKDVFLAFVAAFCLLFMYIFPETVKTSVTKSLQICASTLIPSLFPFIVCTRICAEFMMRLKKSTQNHIMPIVNVSTNGLIIFILGLISGFPGGAVLASSAYTARAITKEEAQRIIAFSNSASPSFCIMVFGNEIMKNMLCGFIVFSATIVVNIIFFIISGFVSLSRDKEKQIEDVIPYTTYKKTNISTIIADSSVIMLNICAFVTFFFCLGNLIYKILSLHFEISDVVSAILYSSLEISGGIAALNKLPFGQKFLVGSMLLGFGGVSAIMQVSSVCEKSDLSINSFVLAKFLSVSTVPIISTLLSMLYTEILYNNKNFRYEFDIFNNAHLIFASAILYMIFILMLFIGISRYKKYKKVN